MHGDRHCETPTANISDQSLAAGLAWLDRFATRHGRPLRVLHVGNIAANGFLNAKFQRHYGISADVVSRDYYHIMALPEWEELDLQHPHGDDNAPQIDPRDLVGYERPNWFFMGSLSECADAIDDNYARLSRKKMIWRKLRSEVQRGTVFAFRHLLGRYAADVANLAFANMRYFRHRLSEVMLPERLRGTCERSSATVELFERVFPARQDKLTAADVVPHFANSDIFLRMFRYYDIVQCYATEPIYALLAGVTKYVAFEHGTLRDFTLADDGLSRLNALAYNRAAHCFITNGDCIEYARSIGVKDFSPIPHPIDIEQHRNVNAKLVAELRASLNADVVLFCPVRHDYAVKGTNVHLHALPLIRKRLAGRSVKLVLISWGAQVSESQSFLDKIGCSDAVLWRGSLSRLAMIRQIHASDVVLDQMALPHFGSTAPQCLAAGVPVVSSYVPSSTEWMFPEPPPIIPAFDAEQVANAVVMALDSGWRQLNRERARHWVDRHHSRERIVADHLHVYQKVLQ